MMKRTIFQKVLYIELAFASLIPFGTAVAETVALSPEFRLDLRQDPSGNRLASGVERFTLSPEWSSPGLAGKETDVIHVAPDGTRELLYTFTENSGWGSFDWNSLSARSGIHQFTHVIRDGKNVLNQFSMTFTVPAPVIPKSLKITGPMTIYPGSDSGYACLACFPNGEERAVSVEWRISDQNATISEDGILHVPEGMSRGLLTLTALYHLDGEVYRGDSQLSILPDYLSVGTLRVAASLEAAAYPVAVECCGEWTASSSESWVSLSGQSAGNGNGTLHLQVDANTPRILRQAVVTVTHGKLTRKIHVVQSSGKTDWTVSFDPQGGVSAFTEHVYKIGSPYGTLPDVSLPGKKFGGWWSAKGGKGEEIRIITPVAEDVSQLYAFWEEKREKAALGGALEWQQDPTGPWVIDSSESVDDGFSMRSGAGELSTISTSVEGPGTLFFYWKISGEGEAGLLDFYDGPSKKVFEVSHAQDWTLQNYQINDSGAHTLKWTYFDPHIQEAGSRGAWLDQVIWMPDYYPGEPSGDKTVPFAWRALYGLTDIVWDPERDSDGDGLSDFDEYISGSDPTDRVSTFLLYLGYSADFQLTLRPLPNLTPLRVYTYEGKERLNSPEWVSPTNSAHHFFRAKASLKR